MDEPKYLIINPLRIDLVRTNKITQRKNVL